MKEEKKFDFRTLAGVGVYVVILIVSGYFLQSKENGIGIFILIALVGLIILVVMHAKVAIYTCLDCNKEFKISPIVDLVSPHKMDSKYLKCPHCGKKSWHKEKR